MYVLYSVLAGKPLKSDIVNPDIKILSDDLLIYGYFRDWLAKILTLECDAASQAKVGEFV
jgi:hypothetical protein